MFIANQEIVAPYYQNIQSQEIQMTRDNVSELSNQNAAVLQMFDRFVGTLKPDLSGDALLKLLDAISFAAEKHRFQTRKDANKTPYVIHPMGVALSLWKEGSIRNQDVILAALLHDTLEDTDATKEELASFFGPKVADIVEELSNPSEMTSEEAKAWQVEHAPSLSPEAKLVKLADRLYNVRDLKNAVWSKEEIERYYGWGQKLLDVLKGTNLQLEEQLQSELHS